MSFEGYLTDQQITELINALMDAQLADLLTQRALRQALDPHYRYSLADHLVAKNQLYDDVKRMNRVHNLRNGNVPLAQYLNAASLLGSASPASVVIDDMLQHVRYTGKAPPPESRISGAPPAGRTIDPSVVLQAQTGALDQTVSVEFLRNGVRAAESVLKILTHRHMDGEPEFIEGDEPRLINGTGWFIAPRLVITNHHVINARRKDVQPEPDATEADFKLQAEHTTLQLDYVNANAGLTGIQSGAGALLYANAALDFALIRIADPGASRPALRLRKNAIKKNLAQALGMGVNLLQHSNGDPMRLGFRNNYVVFGSGDTLSYLTDTAVGSSGSPVCDDAWTVAALHSGSRRIEADISILGHRYTRENFGIPMTAILAHLAEHAPSLHEEISQGQA